MRIKYCRKYEKYVSQQHCEFFNEGARCEYYGVNYWTSIKNLLGDEDRPKWEVNSIIKPFHCDLMNRAYFNQVSGKRRYGRHVYG